MGVGSITMPFAYNIAIQSDMNFCQRGSGDISYMCANYYEIRIQSDTGTGDDEAGVTLAGDTGANDPGIWQHRKSWRAIPVIRLVVVVRAFMRYLVVSVLVCG
jgi:hypothetical protein